MRWQPRQIFSLAFLLAALISWAGWESPWLGVFFFALGVASVVLDRYERRVRKADDLTALDIQR